MLMFCFANRFCLKNENVIFIELILKYDINELQKANCCLEYCALHCFVAQIEGVMKICQLGRK